MAAVVVAAVVVQRWEISANCASTMVSEESENEETDDKVRVEPGVCTTALKLSRRCYKNCT